MILYQIELCLLIISIYLGISKTEKNINRDWFLVDVRIVSNTNINRDWFLVDVRIVSNKNINRDWFLVDVRIVSNKNINRDWFLVDVRIVSNTKYSIQLNTKLLVIIFKLCIISLTAL